MPHDDLSFQRQSVGDAPEVAPGPKLCERPSQAEVEDAIRVLLRWAGDDPGREGLRDTPKRVAKAYRELFVGYETDPRAYMERTFEEVGGYDELIVLRDIRFVSFCEHHMLPIQGRAHVGYLPTDRVVGISKLARVVEIFSKRLQNQEKLTAQIAQAIETALKPEGVAVLIDAEHQCMTTRGVRHKHVSPITTQFPGVFRSDRMLQERFLRFTQRG